MAAAVVFAVPAGARALRSVAVNPLVPGDRVVCLFDSTEGSTVQHNPLSGAVADALRRQGFLVEWRDAAGGPPSATDVAGARAVITGFKDGRIPRARDLVEFLRETSESGVRVVVIGAFGAFQDAGTGTFLAADVVNRAFLALGVRYEAWWTDDPAKFRVGVLDPSLGPPEAVTSSVTRHFYQFSPARPDVRVLVSGQRTDAVLPPSALVFASSTGAMALSRYLSADDMLADARVSHLDLDAFLHAALARRPAAPATLLVVVDPAAEDSRRALAAVRTAAAYAGVPLATVAVGAASALRPMDLASYAGIVLALPEVPSPLDDYLAGLVRNHAAGGGRALSVLPVRDRPLAAAFGHEGGAPVPYKASRLRFEAASFPGLGGFVIDLPTPAFTGLRAVLPSRCTVAAHAVTPEGDIPMWWRCPSGRGEVATLNAYELTDRASLGVMVQALLDVEGRWAMPILAATVEFVDDCPLPMTGAVVPSLGKTDAAFYRDDFYGTLRDASKRLGARPTFLAMFTYDDRVTGPYGPPWPGPTGDASRELAAQIVADDFPVGLHGMTHVSPGLSGGVTRPFPDDAALRAQLEAAGRAFDATFGPQNVPVVYVPPNDWIDAAGKRALVAAVPQVRVLASVFVGSDVEAEQDFGPDPDQPSLVDLPRTWAGMSLTGEAAVGMVNGLLAVVVSTHFVHPDDVLDPERSGGLPWPRLRDSWVRGMDEMKRRFPYLRPMTALRAADEVRRLGETGLTVAATGDSRVTVTRASGLEGPLALLVRLPAGCKAGADGGEVVVTDPVSGRHVVRMDRRILVVGCEGGADSGVRALAAR
jgi:hypothetical protein